MLPLDNGSPIEYAYCVVETRRDDESIAGIGEFRLGLAGALITY